MDEYNRCAGEVSGLQGGTIRVLILAHSHGAVVLATSMENAAIQRIKGCIEIATFGGAQLIANSMCRKVQNFINATDLVSIGAQTDMGDPNERGLEGMIGHLQRIFVSDLLGSTAYQDPELAMRIGSALRTYEKIKQGIDPVSAYMTTLSENVVAFMQREGMDEENQMQLINGAVVVLFLELKYNVQILQPVESLRIDHAVETYYPKVRDVIALPQ